MMNELETKLAAARTRLILDKPFLGALVLRLAATAADPKWCATTATDARRLYYNAEYVRALDLEQLQFVLAHEALHCALSHFARRGHRIKHRWDLACDHAINPLLVEDGLRPPPGVLIEDSFKGMTAEEIYPCIEENSAEQPMDRHLYDEQEGEGGTGPQDPDSAHDEGGGTADGGGSQPEAELDEHSGRASQPPPLTAAERETLSVQWQQRMAGAAQQAMQAGKLGGSLARIIDHLLQPQLPWRMLLARYASATARDDYSYARPSRREGAAILPSLRSAEVNLVIALDVSGSVSDEEVREFLAEINALKGQIRARITLHACDVRLAQDGPWLFEPWEEFRAPREFQGGGGTNFRPIFDWIDTLGQEPDLLVYFTDAQGQFPDAEPHYPVIWLVKGKAKVPWGTRIQLN
jgi:predicted metal-dependent peptidase